MTDDRDPFADADAANADRARRAELERFARERQARRGAAPLPEGGLFDEVHRTTRELF